MGTSSQKTQDHKKIKQWAEERGGKPAIVRGTEGDEEGSGLLRIKFDKAEDDLEEIEWDEFFETFDDRDLTFLYQEKTKGHESRFFKFVREG